MKHQINAMAISGVLLGAGLALTGCAAAGLSLAPALKAAPPTHAGPPENPGPPSHAGPPSWAPAPEHAGPPAADPSEDPEDQWRTVSYNELTFEIPSDWEVVQLCGEDCHELTTSYDVWDAENHLVMQFVTNSAVDTDGDTNTYQREVLDSAAAPGLDFRPTSMVSYYWVASGGAQDFTVAVIDDEEWQTRTTAPALDYFKTSADAWPMMWMDGDYLQALGYDADGQITIEEARAFLATDEYTTLKDVMTSVRTTP